MTAIDDGSPSERIRELQEGEVAFSHMLVELEHALAVEACAISRVFEQAGVAFDPLTFVALRIVTESTEAEFDTVGVLAELHDRGVLENAVDMAGGSLLDGDPAS